MTKKYNDDDNRIIADMSGLEQGSLFSQWFGIIDPNVRAAHGPRKSRPSENRSKASATDGIDLTPEERWALIKYTMKYALGLGLVFVTVIGIAILLLLKLWS